MKAPEPGPEFPSACRKRPGRTVYAQMYNEKEQEMTSPVGHPPGTQSGSQGEEFIDDDLDSQTLGNACVPSIIRVQRWVQRPGDQSWLLGPSSS